MAKCFSRFIIWNENKTLEKVLKKINWQGSYKKFTEMRYQLPYGGVTISKKYLSSATEKDCDAGKKISGIKRHIGL